MAATPGLYRCLVNLAQAGSAGDVDGSLLAILSGASSAAKGQGIVQTLISAAVREPQPIRVGLQPLSRQQGRWRPCMGRQPRNPVHPHHHGGSWPCAGGFGAMALAPTDRAAQNWHADTPLLAPRAMQQEGTARVRP